MNDHEKHEGHDNDKDKDKDKNHGNHNGHGGGGDRKPGKSHAMTINNVKH